ncbi:MAG: hypothetical protein ACFFAS_18365 [Promethearchaeota archaeon]
MSKFDRHKSKSTEIYIDPHRHCKKCKKMIDESIWYCPDCYKQLKEKKKRKFLGRFRKSKGEKEPTEKNKKD